MSKETLIACLFSLLAWDVLRFAIRRTLLVFAMRRMSPDQIAMLVNPTAPPAIDSESLRDENTFIDGWRACERCRRLPPSIVADHILHHYSWDGSIKEKTAACAADDLTKERERDKIRDFSSLCCRVGPRGLICSLPLDHAGDHSHGADSWSDHWITCS